MAIQEIAEWTRSKISQIKSEKLTSKEVNTIIDLVDTRQEANPIFRAVIPEFLFKPPFGFPRNINVPFLRGLARNPYVYSIIKTLEDEAATTGWDIVPLDGIIMDDNLRKQRQFIKQFFNNPNDDDESFENMLRKWINDFAVLDSPCIEKVHNKLGELLQLRTIDGGTIVKNPDIHGRLASRADFITDAPRFFQNVAQSTGESFKQIDAVKEFRSTFAEQAAYFQFSNTLVVSLPIPFGRKEVVFMMMSPNPSGVYSFASPLQAAAEVVLNLVFGEKYSLDFYMNSNTPEGIVMAAGANQAQIDTLKERLRFSQYTNDEVTGLQRRVGYRLPITNADDVKFIPLTFSAKDMEIIAQQEWFTKVLWMNFGVTADEMGFTQNSNKATSQEQGKVSRRKAIKPMLRTLEYHFNTQILPELPGGENFRFKFDEFDIGDEIKKRQLQQMEIAMGIKTWQMIAEEEGIDVKRLTEDKEANLALVPEAPGNNEGKNTSEKKSDNVELKPMGPFKDFADCMRKQKAKGFSEERAGKICGAIKQKVEGKGIDNPAEYKTLDLDQVIQQITQEIEETGEKLVNQAAGGI